MAPGTVQLNMRQRVPLLLLCAALGIASFVLLDYWNSRNAPLYRRLERQWADDVDELEASGKLPKEWFDVQLIEVIGGTPETRDWLNRIHVPLQAKKGGKNKMEVLVVVWEEDGKRGAMIRYILENLESKKTVREIGRTLILSKPRDKNPLKALLQEFDL